MLVYINILFVGLFGAVPSIISQRCRRALVSAGVVAGVASLLHYFEVYNIRHIDCLVYSSFAALGIGSIVSVLNSRSVKAGIAMYVSAGCLILLSLPILDRAGKSQNLLEKTGLEVGAPEGLCQTLSWSEEQGIERAAGTFDLGAALLVEGEKQLRSQPKYRWNDITCVHAELDSNGVMQVIGAVTGLRISVTPDVKGVACWTPSTGEVRHFELSALPEWVKSVYGESLAKGRLAQWLFTETAVDADEVQYCVKRSNRGGGVASLRRLRSEDGQTYWFAEAVSSKNNRIGLIAGFLFMNERTGTIHFEQVVGMMADNASNSITRAVSKEGNWHAGEPMPLYLEGIGWTYAADVLNYKGDVEGMAVVRFKDGQIFAAETAAQAVTSAQLEPLGVQQLVFHQ
jgi:hypothetical protein